MRFETVHGIGGARAGLAALAAAVALTATGCKLQPEATTCPTGIYCPAGTRCAARQAVCIVDSCGDGIVQAGEACDDGNVVDADGCSHDCKSTEICGNGIKDVAVGELCDDGNTVDGDKCAADCRSTESCGNGIRDTGEACDDAGESLTCNVNCTIARHGDGVVNVTAGERCDGNGTGIGNGKDCEWAGCNYDCTPSVHGDGIVNELDGEKCDGDNVGHGNGQNCQSSICNANCTWSVHGDGFVNPEAGEACDGGIPGASSPSCESASCNANCSLSRHGDGIVNPSAGEKCDGGVVGGMSPSCESTTCNADCTFSACGDGIVNSTADEKCDDGNANAQDDCNACRVTWCGDGIVDLFGPSRIEACDLGGRNGATDCLYGETSCDGCSATCDAPLATNTYYCGNGVVDTGRKDASGAVHDEDCDDPRSFACNTCFASGTKSCMTNPARAAVGSVTVQSADVPDETTITLGDGVRTIVIELDRSGACVHAPDACVTTSSKDDVNTLAARLESAINQLYRGGNVAVFARRADAVLTLRNTASGIVGNVPIGRAPPEATAITVEGMRDGAGCGLDAPCATGDDCVSGVCSGNVCATALP